MKRLWINFICWLNRNKPQEKFWGISEKELQKGLQDIWDYDDKNNIRKRCIRWLRKMGGLVK